MRIIEPGDKVECVGLRVYRDPDGYEFLEQEFDDGSKALMHRYQYDAICLAVARSLSLQKNIMIAAGEEPVPDPVDPGPLVVGSADLADDQLRQRYLAGWRERCKDMVARNEITQENAAANLSGLESWTTAEIVERSHMLGIEPVQP